MKTSASSAASPQPTSNASVRQAVILIHGIGEQRPMATLRAFVDSVLNQTGSDSQADAKYYSKPDLLADNLELRRLVSARTRNVRTDFYEFYWAHLMPTATWGRLASWYWLLMRRRPWDVPKRFLVLWGLSWLATMIFAGFGAYTTARFLLGYPVTEAILKSAPWFLLAVLGLLSTTFRSYLGDAAVYLSPAPPNIEARQKIRAAGLSLLDKVAGSGRYDRIIVVGHSLGSVIGYDVLTFAWQRHVEDVREKLSAAWRADQYPAIDVTALRAAEKLAKIIRDTVKPTREEVKEQADLWREATRALAAEWRANGADWRVTDFVTLGSPLAHGDLLLASSRTDFERRARERELPHCPPVRELNGRFSFEHQGQDNKGRPQHGWILNHAALFATTAWTNLYFPCHWLLVGDVVGGPIAPLFWGGVRDVAVKTKIWHGWLAHTHYWQRDIRDTDPAVSPVPQLRQALDLQRKENTKSPTTKPVAP